MTDQELVDQLEAVWASMEALAAELSPEEWGRPTACPGWTVQDQIAHVIGIESTILGRPGPEPATVDASHVHNDIGRVNEAWVDSRRPRSGAEVLEELREVTAARIAGLRALPPEGFDAESWTPVGPGTVRDLLPFRVFDSWVHEQDVREAVGRPGHLEGPVAEAAVDRLVAAMPYVVGKKVRPGEGATVAFEVTGPVRRSFVVGVEGGRARILEGHGGEPTARLAMDARTFCRLGCGRLAPTGAKVTVEGDEAVGRAVLERMNILF
ncbi:MAG: maleylpyruvate isomerase family mycothiol-dependent enzyme [Acidimicrobiia bacterium]|nr:maleylpyruvate isomerase family mycothiol-dependent enzyme [Acidimicrobiia bacterium]